mmetsp:Transcript_100647/g.290757  ORF Transcript_100647/g.290757 Transcript_100647/m.290757 type:complete len:393 (-) Transcript_100647:46-1224(-)
MALDGMAEKFADAFDKNGCVTEFLERLPIAGFAVGAVHAAAENESHAKRAASRSLNSTVAAGVGAAALAAAPVTGGAALMGIGAMGGLAGVAIGHGAQALCEAAYDAKDQDEVGCEILDKDATGWTLDLTIGAVTGGISGGLKNPVAGMQESVLGPPTTYGKALPTPAGPLSVRGVDPYRWASNKAVEMAIKTPVTVPATQLVSAVLLSTAEAEGTASGTIIAVVGRQDKTTAVGRYVAAHIAYPSDARDGESTYVCVHEDPKKCALFSVEDVDRGFLLKLTDSADATGNYSRGRYLAVHLAHEQDIRDAESGYVILHGDKKKAAVWNVDTSGASVALKVVSTQGFAAKLDSAYLAADSPRAGDRRDSVSTYLIVHRDSSKRLPLALAPVGG